jgi:hypothetical protein
MITMGPPYFVWINTSTIILSWYLLDAVCVTPPPSSHEWRTAALEWMRAALKFTIASDCFGRLIRVSPVESTPVPVLDNTRGSRRGNRMAAAPLCDPPPRRRRRAAPRAPSGARASRSACSPPPARATVRRVRVNVARVNMNRILSNCGKHIECPPRPLPAAGPRPAAQPRRAGRARAGRSRAQADSARGPHRTSPPHPSTVVCT